MLVWTSYSLVPRPPPAFFELQAIKAGDKAGDEARHLTVLQAMESWEHLAVSSSIFTCDIVIESH